MSGVKKKKSGSEFRKQKLAKEAAEQKQHGSLHAFFSKPGFSASDSNLPGKTTPSPMSPATVESNILPTASTSSTTTNDVVDSNAEDGVNYEPLVKKSRNESETLELEGAINSQPARAIEVQAAMSELLSVSSDPATWNNITDKMRPILIEQGPVQIRDFRFPCDNKGRHFSPIHYERRLNNDEVVSRPWLIYSVSKNLVHCFCCLLFSKDRAHWPVTGTSDWSHLTRNISAHEKFEEHYKAFKQWKEFDSRLKIGKTIDAAHERIMQSEIEHWRDVLKRIIAVLQFLGSQSLALRGTSSTLYDRNNGNFLKLIELLGKFDKTMEEHLRRVTARETNYHYFSNTIQNELISLISNKIREHLIQLILAAKYYSIILDCTPDKSRQEQMSIVIRFVTYNNETNLHEIREHFLGFLPVVVTTGEGLTEAILNELKNLGLPIGDMRGQGYDNGANMKGKRSGVQSRILQINPRATFVPCSCHSLNLVVNDAASASGETIGFFDLVQQLYVFFSGSTSRWDVLKKHISALTVKPVSATRWESRIDAIKPLRYQLGEVYDALVDISLDGNRDKLSQHEAKCLATRITDFKFMCSIIIWHDILSKVNVVSKMLQSPNLHLADCDDLLSEVLDFLQHYRSDENFSKVIDQAKGLASELEVDPCFRPATAVRLRRKKKNFDYEANDEALIDPQKKFQVEFFNFVIDTATSSIRERFELLRSHNKNFQFLQNIGKLKNLNDSDVLQCCKDLQLFLTDGNSTDIDALDLWDELKNLSTLLPPDLTPVETLNYLKKNDIATIFPNLVIALRILLTLPVSVASGERSFSKLKIIKNYLRSTMAQERLVGLATISIESEICESLNYDELISEFAKIKARRVQLQ